MSLNDILIFAGMGIGLLIVIIASYYLFKLLKILVVKILELVGFVARILFKILYFLLTIALALFGIAGIGTSISQYMDGKLDIWAGIIGLVLLYIGSNGFVSFIKNKFEFAWDIPSPNNYTSRTSSSETDYALLTEAYRREEQEKFDKEFRAKLDADADAWDAKKAQWREEEAQAETERARANWEAEQEANAEFWRKHREDEEYNRQERERRGW